MLPLKEAVRRVHERLGLAEDKPDDAAWPTVRRALRAGEIVASGQPVVLSGQTHWEALPDSRLPEPDPDESTPRLLRTLRRLRGNDKRPTPFERAELPPHGRPFEARAVLDIRPIGEISRDWWRERIALKQLPGSAIYLWRKVGANVEWLRDIELAGSEIDRLWPSCKSAGDAAARRPVADVELRTFLRTQADGRKTEADLKETVRTHFEGRHVPKNQWRAAFKDLPSDKKRRRGENARTQRAKGSSG